MLAYPPWTGWCSAPLNMLHTHSHCQGLWDRPIGEGEQLAGGRIALILPAEVASRASVPCQDPRSSAGRCRRLSSGDFRLDSSCVDVMAGTVWPCSCLEFPRYKYVAKASVRCGACCICSAQVDGLKDVFHLYALETLDEFINSLNFTGRKLLGQQQQYT